MSVFIQSLELCYLMISSSNGSVTFILRAPLGICYKRGIISYQCPLLVCMCACSVMSDSLQPRGCSLPGFSVCGIFQARILEWVAIPFSRGSSRPRNQACISESPALAGGFFTTAPPGKPYIFLFCPQTAVTTPSVVPEIPSLELRHYCSRRPMLKCNYLY